MDGFAQKFAEFAASLTEAEDFNDTAEHLILYAVKAVGASFGGITLLRSRGHLETVGATHPKVNQADAAQYELREGPCVDAAQKSRSVLSDCVGNDSRWPRWGPEVARLGISSVLSSEMHGRGRRIGALNLYSHSEKAFDADDVELANILADQSAALMAVMSSERGLREALETRTLIGQAQGMLMERFDIDADQAFSVLRRFSQCSNHPLREIAEQIVKSRQVR